MRDPTIYVLARDPAGAKTRLAPALGADARASLAVAMLEDVLAAARAAGTERLTVVTDASTLGPVAARWEARTMRVPPEGTNGAALAALKDATEHRSPAALVLAADLPLLAADDLVALREAAVSADIVIAPDRHARGTNALLLTPPTAIAPAFGAESYAAHRERAARAGRPHTTLERHGLSHDVDDLDDLRLAAGDASLGAHTRACLAALDARHFIAR